MKKQYRYHEIASFKYAIKLYHDAKLINTREVWLSELYDEVDKLEEQGYTYGFTKDEVEKARLQYEAKLKNIIE